MGRFERSPEARGRANPPAALGLLAALLLGGALAGRALAASSGRPQPLPEYQSSSNCRICHERIHEQHEASRHARAFSDPVFQAQYRQTVLAAGDDPTLGEEAKRCLACHSPVSFLKHRDARAPLPEPDPSLAGVICDFCHRIGTFKGDRPGGGNFMSSPGSRKFGPLKHPASDWHHVYHELQTKSELCGICHDDATRAGLRTMATYTEWRESGFAAEGVQCQDCHMSRSGPGGGGVDGARFESGKAATMSVGTSEVRAALHSHRFPGGGDAARGERALTLAVGLDRQAAAPAEEVAVSVEVRNLRAGHSVPTGSVELRLVWLEVSAVLDGAEVRLPATPAGGGGYDVAGAAGADPAMSEEAAPAGSRLYRTVLADASGAPTFLAHRAAAVVFDNRLKSREARTERYTFRVPPGAGGTLRFVARAWYLAYPPAIARAFGIPAAEPVLMAETQAALALAGPGSP